MMPAQKIPPKLQAPAISHHVRGGTARSCAILAGAVPQGSTSHNVKPAKHRCPAMAAAIG